jgi:hypothetical protein
MTSLLRRTAQSATWLLAACTIIWIVGGIAQDRPIVWENLAVLWLVGWPVLFVGFSLTDWAERTGPR